VRTAVQKRQRDLNNSHSVTKSSWGGKRTGAGRPRTGRDHKDWRLEYVAKNAHPLLMTLMLELDWGEKPVMVGFVPTCCPTFLTIHQVYKLCCSYPNQFWNSKKGEWDLHDPEHTQWARLYPTHHGQLLKLVEKYRDVLERFVRKYSTDKWVDLAKQLLEVQP